VLYRRQIAVPTRNAEETQSAFPYIFGRCREVIAEGNTLFDPFSKMGTRFLDRARQQNTYERHVCLCVDLPISTIVPVDGAYRPPDVNN